MLIVIVVIMEYRSQVRRVFRIGRTGGRGLAGPDYVILGTPARLILLLATHTKRSRYATVMTHNHADIR